jgi:UDP-N-acetylmuramoylalanine--D-glutamate ligase
MITAASIALFDQWRQTAREVAVLGLGKSGVAATLLLRDHAIPVYASDSGSGTALQASSQSLTEAGAVVQLGGHDTNRVAGAAAVIVAPGVPPDVAPLTAARQAGV